MRFNGGLVIFHRDLIISIGISWPSFFIGFSLWKSVHRQYIPRERKGNSHRHETLRNRNSRQEIVFWDKRNDSKRNAGYHAFFQMLVPGV